MEEKTRRLCLNACLTAFVLGIGTAFVGGPIERYCSRKSDRIRSLLPEIQRIEEIGSEIRRIEELPKALPGLILGPKLRTKKERLEAERASYLKETEVSYGKEKYDIHCSKRDKASMFTFGGLALAIAGGIGLYNLDKKEEEN